MECPACHTPNVDGARFCAKCGALLPAEQTEVDPLIGTVVGGRFRILGVLGEGGMGRVYTAEQQMGTTTRKVAVKTLLAEFARDPKVVERFMRECATVVELEHPNTIKFYDYGKTDAGDLYIAMELLTGASLEKALEGGALAPDRVDRILSQIAGSLQEAHDKGIVHRDLKPANIFLTTRAGEGDYVKVLDFGIAKRDEKHSKAEAKLTQQGTVLGTPPYMSPEQFKGQELDARSDIYSLGVMSYEMLTGRLPFDADTPWAWATQHMTAQPFPFETVPIGSAVPAKMKAAVMRALSKDKSQRHQSVREFYEELTMGGGGRLLDGLRAPTLERLGRWSRSGDGAAPTQAGVPGYPSGAQSLQHTPSSPGVIGAAPAYPSSSGMAVPAGAYPGAPPVPAPTAKAPRKSSAGLIVGALVLVGALGALGVFVLGKQKGPTTGAEGADAGAATTAVVDTGKPPAQQDAGAPPVSTAVADVGPPSHPQHNPHDQDCKAAEQAARDNNLEEAQRRLKKCEGPLREAAERCREGCRGRQEEALPRWILQQMSAWRAVC